MEVIKEVPVEVVKTVVKEVPREVIKEVPVEVIKEVIIEAPREVIKEVEVVKEVRSGAFVARSGAPVLASAPVASAPAPCALPCALPCAPAGALRPAREHDLSSRRVVALRWR